MHGSTIGLFLGGRFFHVGGTAWHGAVWRRATHAAAAGRRACARAHASSFPCHVQLSCNRPTGSSYMFCSCWRAAAFRATRRPAVPTSKTYSSMRQLMEPLAKLLLTKAKSNSRQATATKRRMLLEGRATALGRDYCCGTAAPGAQPSRAELMSAATLVYTPQQPASQDQVLRLVLSRSLIERHIKERAAEDKAAGSVQAKSSRRIVRGNANSSGERPTCLMCVSLPADHPLPPGSSSLTISPLMHTTTCLDPQSGVS